ncbi:hypothetical protein D3C71_2037120 [compost metagenome]
MAHGNAVVHGDGVEFLGNTACSLNLTGYELAQVLQVHMAGNELGERIDDGDDRLGEVTILHAGGTPQRAGASHIAAGGRGFGTVCGHRGTRENR